MTEPQQQVRSTNVLQPANLTDGEPARGIAVEINTRSDGRPGPAVLGYRVGRFLIAGTFDLGFFPGVAGRKTYVGYGFGATLRVRVASSADQRVELFGQGDLGVSNYGVNKEGVVGSSSTNYFAGFGVNYWIHRSFALGGRVGMRGSALSDDTSIQSGGTDSGLHALAVF